MVAAANTEGGGAADPAEELKGFKAAFDDLSNAASSASGPLDELSAVKSVLASVTLSTDDFGPSGEANGIVKYWNDAVDQRGKELDFLINGIADMAEKLHRVVNNYIENEEKN